MGHHSFLRPVSIVKEELLSDVDSSSSHKNDTRNFPEKNEQDMFRSVAAKTILGTFLRIKKTD